MPFEPFGYDEHHVARARLVGVLRGSFTDPGLTRRKHSVGVALRRCGGKRAIIRIIDGKIIASTGDALHPSVDAGCG